ncbi:MAG: hypothetical protein COB24_07435 [Hyphomicrobiales bacterium]|nr:MAG: hypothetical protein COB24_07435 [Hyphomicrobiales bacterium]
MKILHFFLGKANPDRANGVNHVINGYGKELAKNGVTAHFVGLSSLDNAQSDIIQRDGFEVEVYDGFFSNCLPRLKELAFEVDIVHLHSVWNHYNIYFARFLIKNKIPYVITAHAGLVEDRLNQSRKLLKIIYHKLLQKPVYDKASGIHAITKEEILSIARNTDNENIFHVSNGLDLKNFPLKSKEHFSQSIIKIGYLGRFGVEKNLASLIKALHILPKQYAAQIELNLIGPIDGDAEKLRVMIDDLGVKNVVFTGAIYGAEKYDFLGKLDFYIHPALSDVVSIALMEAFASGLPTIVTRTSHVSYYYKSNAFIMVEPTFNDISRAIIDMLDKKSDWKDMSQSAIDLVKTSFDWKNNAKDMIHEYEQILELT